jgi:transposase InsO family protein
MLSAAFWLSSGTTWEYVPRVRATWPTREQLRLAIVVWIERTYHRRRRQDTFGRLTPIEFETLVQVAHAA